MHVHVYEPRKKLSGKIWLRRHCKPPGIEGWKAEKEKIMICERGRLAQIDVVADKCVVELVRLRVALMIAHGMDKTLRKK